jgi:hypothetical protein
MLDSRFSQKTQATKYLFCLSAMVCVPLLAAPKTPVKKSPVSKAAKTQTSPLQRAIAALDDISDEKPIIALLKKGLPLTTKVEGDPLIFHLVWTPTVVPLKIWLERGANPNVSTEGSLGPGKTPLMMAAESSNPQAIVLLVKHGARLNEKQADGDAALHYAATMGDSETIQSLLTCKANIEARGDGGYTPLIAAAAFNNRETVEALLQQGADVRARATDGTTALDAALRLASAQSPEVEAARKRPPGKRSARDLVIIEYSDTERARAAYTAALLEAALKRTPAVKSS